MMRDFAIYYKGQYIGTFRDYDQAGAIKQAKMKVVTASKYSSATDTDFIAMKLGIL